MKKSRQFCGSVTCTSLLMTAVAFSATTALGSMYYTPAGAGDSNGSVDASAQVIVGNGMVTITLTDLLQNPTSSGQTLSGLEIDISGAIGTATLASSSGLTSTINPDGAYTPGVYQNSLGHWGADDSVNLSAIGLVSHQPYDLIVGPDSAGGFSGAGTYSGANKGLGNFNPYVLGSATFTVDIPGVTSSSSISGVNFEFGTAPETVPAVSYSPVPEAGSIYGAAPVALGLLPLSAAFLRKLRNRQAFGTGTNPLAK
ncbi:MAG TPA: hypothetical protein VNZ25_07675 [Candidatus Angelobacter sp.]|nr:hypothetical protein [Candidatus Angelobacter sp.]